MNEDRRQNDLLILDELADIKKRLSSLEEQIAPINSLKGFWKVLGVLLGAAALLGAGVAGIITVYGFFKNHIV